MGRGGVVLVGALVVLRVVVAAATVLGPWTDEASELDGWDAARFQEILDAEGTPHVDHPVEYPPGALVALEVLGADDVVSTQRHLVVAMLVADLAVAGVLAWRWGRPAAVAWLVLGLAVLPGAYLRFDLLSVLLAVAGIALAGRSRPARGGLALAAAVLVKTWPVVVAPALLRAGRSRALLWATGSAAVAGLLWVGWVGFEGPLQVVGFRGATGWHVESTPGLLAGLVSGEQAVLESGAYRLGRSSAAVSLVLALLLVAGLALLWRRALVGAASEDPDRSDALAAAGAVALLLVTAPLLSPQYLVWLLPWAAICWARGERGLVVVVAAAALLTATVLAAVGPPGVDAAPAQLALLVRNGLLLATPVLAFRRLGAPPPAAAPPVGATAPATAGPAAPGPRP